MFPVRILDHFNCIESYTSITHTICDTLELCGFEKDFPSGGRCHIEKTGMLWGTFSYFKLMRKPCIIMFNAKPCKPGLFSLSSLHRKFHS